MILVSTENVEIFEYLAHDIIQNKRNDRSLNQTKFIDGMIEIEVARDRKTKIYRSN